MMRVCHLDTCPVGIATQNPVLRERFTGKPEFVENFFLFLAEEVRELPGRAGLPHPRRGDRARRAARRAARPSTTGRRSGLDLTPLLYVPDAARRTRPGAQTTAGPPAGEGARQRADRAGRAGAATTAPPVRLELAVRNEHRSVGAMLGGEVVRRLRRRRPARRHHRRSPCAAPAGQSFGAFAAARRHAAAARRRQRLRRQGPVRRPADRAAGRARRRSSPRSTSSPATPSCTARPPASCSCAAGSASGSRCATPAPSAVVEGVGDHGCEYMTGGTVVVLGPTGRNFAAGMSGGAAFVLAAGPQPGQPRAGRPGPGRPTRSRARCAAWSSGTSPRPARRSPSELLADWAGGGRPSSPRWCRATTSG